MVASSESASWNSATNPNTASGLLQTEVDLAELDARGILMAMLTVEGPPSASDLAPHTNEVAGDGLAAVPADVGEAKDNTMDPQFTLPSLTTPSSVTTIIDVNRSAGTLLMLAHRCASDATGMTVDHGNVGADADVERFSTSSGDTYDVLVTEGSVNCALASRVDQACGHAPDSSGGPTPSSCSNLATCVADHASTRPATTGASSMTQSGLVHWEVAVVVHLPCHLDVATPWIPTFVSEGDMTPAVRLWKTGSGECGSYVHDEGWGYHRAWEHNFVPYAEIADIWYNSSKFPFIDDSIMVDMVNDAIGVSRGKGHVHFQTNCAWQFVWDYANATAVRYNWVASQLATALAPATTVWEIFPSPTGAYARLEGDGDGQIALEPAEGPGVGFDVSTWEFDCTFDMYEGTAWTGVAHADGASWVT